MSFIVLCLTHQLAYAGPKMNPPSSRSLSAQPPASPTQSMEPLLTSEFSKIHAEMRGSVEKFQQRLAELKSQKDRALAQSKKLFDSETASLEILKKFEMLINIRYIDDKGVFQPGAEVSPSDVENLNKVIENCLHWRPFQGRTSAGHVLRTLQKAKDRLQEEIKDHGDPNMNNNSDLEIVEKMEQQILAQVKTINETASKLNLNLSVAPPKATASEEGSAKESVRSKTPIATPTAHPAVETDSDDDSDSGE
ncbi:MAG: hypothetical protein ACO3A2_09940 [Bdellovibrionia bacterium]